MHAPQPLTNCPLDLSENITIVTDEPFCDDLMINHLQDKILQGCSLDSLTEGTAGTQLKTSIAKHIFNILGDSPDLQHFDHLRSQFKQKWRKLSKNETASFDQLLAKLQSYVLREVYSSKYTK